MKEGLDRAEKETADILPEVAEAVGGKGGILYGLLQGFTNIIVRFTATFLPAIVSMVPSGLTAMTDHLKSKYAEGFTANAVNLLDVIKDYGLLDDSGIKALNTITKTFGGLQSPLLMASIVMIVIDYMKGLMQASMGKIMQGYNAAYAPYAVDAGSAARAAFIDPSFYDQAKSALRRNGLSDDDITLLYLSMNKTQDADTVRTLYLRKIYSIDQARAELSRQGLTAKRIEDLMQTWVLIPGPNDLIRMAVREAFDERKASELGLDDNPQQPFIEWADKQGLSAYWSKMYWRAHWELPSPQMGFEMLHRGIITEDELRSLLVALDYSPRWHDSLMGISYNVMTRVDVRRIFELGLINPEEMEKEYLHQGYSPKDAKLLRAWTEVEYNQEYKDITKNEVIKQFLEGIISDAQCRDMLAYMGYTLDRRETMIALATYQRAYAKQTALIAALKKLYIMGEYDISRVQQELAPYNIDPRRIVELIDQWEVERKAGVAVPKKAELDRFFLEGIINEQEYFTEMQRIGHAEKNIARYIKSIKIAMAKEAAEKAGGK
jgi:hypothetical protein